MASINGISIKSLKKFKDHEGIYIYQGNVYYKNKKLGFWSQDAWCGCDHFDFDTSVLDDEVERYRKSDMVEDMYRDVVGLDSLLSKLVGIIDREKLYKKWSKDGYGTMFVASDRHSWRACAFASDENVVLENGWLADFKKECEGELKGWDGEFTVYDSLDDFNLTV